MKGMSSGEQVSDEQFRQLTTLHQRLATQNRHVADAFARSEQLSERELEALLAVMQAEEDGAPLTAGALGRAVRLSAAATTSLIDKLERVGHLERRRGELDRRSVTLHYSARARQVAVQFFTPLGRVTHDVFAEFGDAEREVIVRYLERMTDAMESHAQSLQSGAD